MAESESRKQARADALEQIKKDGQRGARIKTSEPEKRTVDGIVFHSAAEAQRYGELKLLERVGSITDLELQPEIVLQEAFDHPTEGRIAKISYFGDFGYTRRHVKVVEDTKGFRTEVYKLKRKLALHKYPDIRFEEVQV